MNGLEQSDGFSYDVVMIVKAVRGATALHKDNKNEMIQVVNELISRLFEENSLKEKAVVSIIFSVTKDLKSLNPAAALRKNGYGSIPLFCTQEPHSKGAPKKIVRVLITFNSEVDFQVKPIYINGAERLRPDLSVK